MLWFLPCVGFQRDIQKASGYLQLIVCRQMSATRRTPFTASSIEHAIHGLQHTEHNLQHIQHTKHNSSTHITHHLQQTKADTFRHHMEHLHPHALLERLIRGSPFSGFLSFVFRSCQHQHFIGKPMKNLSRRLHTPCSEKSIN
jgi:hypothetical protein